MKRILLVNPPIFDFTAYDFWLKPFGVLKIGGFLRNRCQLRLFDFLDRKHPFLEQFPLKEDPWGRGKFYSTAAPLPEVFSGLSKRYRRFGLPLELFELELADYGPFDFVLIQTGMSYWYQGVEEVIGAIRRNSSSTKIIIGGVYSTLCPEHAHSLGADLCVSGLDLSELWKTIGIVPDLEEPPFWEGYRELSAGIIKLTEGCPFRCTYCSVSRVYNGFHINSLDYSQASLEVAMAQGAVNFAFYDDSLLFRWELGLKPFLTWLNQHRYRINFHTPNALNARMINRENSVMMTASGFRHFFLGFESLDRQWQSLTGSKVDGSELARAVKLLLDAGAEAARIAAYIIIGHPESRLQDIEGSIRFARSLGIKVMLSEFSPIPGTPDGEKCRGWIDLDDPLQHNKVFFSHARLGGERIQELKSLCHEHNRKVAEDQNGFQDS